MEMEVGLTKFGIAEYAAPTKLKINAPFRPPDITFQPHEPDAQRVLEALQDKAEPLHLRTRDAGTRERGTRAGRGTATGRVGPPGQGRDEVGGRIILVDTLRRL